MPETPATQAQYVFYLTVQLVCPLPVRDNLNKYVYSTTRIRNIWYMEPRPAQAELVFLYCIHRLAPFPSEITMQNKIESILQLQNLMGT